MLTRRQFLAGGLALPAINPRWCQKLREELEPRMSETLHNGLVIPYPGGDGFWPPRDITPETLPPSVSSPVPLPWKTNIPAAIGINDGAQFLGDDFLIASSNNLTRRWFSGQPYEGNPVLKADKPWEQLSISIGTLSPPAGVAAAFYGGIWFDQQRQCLVMSYLAGDLYTAFATSTDWGITWDKPNLGRITFNGNKNNNLTIDHFAEGGIDQARDSAMMTYDPTRPSEPWVYMFARGLGAGFLNCRVRRSVDGICWGPDLMTTRQTSDGATIHWNPFRQRWIWSLRYNDASGMEGRRYRKYWETPNSDLVGNPFDDNSIAVMWDRAHWDGTGYPTTVSGWDADQQIYNTPVASFIPEMYHRNVFPGPSLMMGWDTILMHNQLVLDRPKCNEPRFVFSRDGFHYERIHDFFPFGRLPSTRHVWNYGNITSTGAPFVYNTNGREMYHWASGRSGRPGGSNASGDMLMGRFTWRKDGICAMDFGTSGELQTRTLTHASNRNVLYVNADVPRNGSLKVEVQRSNGAVSPGCSLADCAPITGDNTAYKVTFDARRIAQPDIPDTFKLRFVGDGGARLYSFYTASESDRGTTT